MWRQPRFLIALGAVLLAMAAYVLLTGDARGPTLRPRPAVSSSLDPRFLSSVLGALGAVAIGAGVLAAIHSRGRR